VLGISHFRLEDGRIVEEWTLFDEIAILRQSYASH
jgi:predicted ester cyclase